MPTPLPIILDGDPGHDDAVNILLAAASPELEILGAVATHGNVALEHTLRNTLALREFARADFPVFVGANRPLVRSELTAAHVHGERGLGDVELPEPTGGPEAERGVEFIVRAALERPGEVTLVVTGPATTAALALRLEPRLASALRGIVLMGGSADFGNVTPASEFNTHADPHAARILFESGARAVMFGLNATRQVPVTPERVEQLRAAGRAGALCAAFMDDYLARLTARGRAHLGSLHDPCTVAYLLRPELFGVQEMLVEVDADEGPNFGRTTCDVTGVRGEDRNAGVAMTADADGVYALLAERLARL